MQLNPKVLGYTVALLSAGFWFLAMSFSLLTGFWIRTMIMWSSFHLAPYSWTGMIILVIEHLIGGFIAGWIFAWLYNKLLAKYSSQ